MSKRFPSLAFLALIGLSNLAHAASTQITKADCSQLSVHVNSYADAEPLFLTLPEKSESHGDSALYRSLEIQTQHDHLRISCALSSGERGMCSLVYRQNSATTDTCSSLPEFYFLSTEMSQKLNQVLRLKGHFFSTSDRVLELGCRTTTFNETECRFAINR